MSKLLPDHHFINRILWAELTALHLQKVLALNINLSPSSAQSFRHNIRFKIAALLNMETIINLAVDKRKSCPDESLTLALSARYHS